MSSKTFAILLLIFSLGGCQSTVVYRCPPLKPYTMAQRQKLASELEAVQSGAAITSFVNDYRNLRDACRSGAK